MSPRNELCTRCGMPIGQSADACVWHDRVVCATCHRHLTNPRRSRARTRWLRTAAALVLTAGATGVVAYMKVRVGH